MEDRWVGLTQRIKQEASKTLANNKRDGVAIVSANILMSADGQPLAWVIGSKRVEPSRDARAVLADILPMLD